MFDNLRAFCWLMMTAGLLIMPLDSGNTGAPEPVAVETSLAAWAVLGFWVIETANRIMGFVAFVRSSETILERVLVAVIVGALVVLLYSAEARGYSNNLILLVFLSLISAALIAANAAFDRLAPKKS